MANERTVTKKDVFTTGEAADLTKLSLQTIIRCFDSGKIKGYRVPGSRFRRMPRESLIAFMRENGIPIPETLLAPAKIRVLIVDDDEALLEMLNDYLGEIEEFELETARTGFDAGAKTLSFLPDVILLDIMLPDINGRDVLRTIKADPKTSHIRIIAISGMIEQDKISDLYESGVDLYLQKPFDLAELVETVRKMSGGG